MNYSEWYLDLKSIADLPKEEKENINSYYREMLNCEFDNRKNMASSFFHTLQKAGYIKNASQEDRSEKLELILDGNNSINT
jgi:hypothetical protein